MSFSCIFTNLIKSNQNCLLTLLIQILRRVNNFLKGNSFCFFNFASWATMTFMMNMNFSFISKMNFHVLQSGNFAKNLEWNFKVFYVKFKWFYDVKGIFLYRWNNFDKVKNLISFKWLQLKELISRAFKLFLIRKIFYSFLLLISLKSFAQNKLTH